MARVVLEQAGEDVIVGGAFNGFGDPTDIDVIGTRSPGEEVEVIRGDIVLDSSFNAGGDVIRLPGEASEYLAELVGSRVVLTDTASQVRISIPIGENANTLIFGGDDTRLIEIENGQVVIGTQVINQFSQLLEGSAAQMAAALSDLQKADADGGWETIDANATPGGIKGDLAGFGKTDSGLVELSDPGLAQTVNLFVESQTFA